MDRPAPRSRYQRYSGGDPLAPPVDLGDALAAIGEDVMAGASPERALSEYLRRGADGRTGLDDLAGRIAQRRRELLSEYRLDGTLAEAAELLDKAVNAERGQLARDIDLDEMDRAFRQLQLDNLPASTAAAVSELADYSWTSQEARDHYEQIRDLLGRELLDQRFAGMKQALENATDADRQAAQEMLGALNDLLEAHRRGEDTAAAFKDFMDAYGDYFPENPQNIEELLDSLAARAAAAQRLRESMTPEQRAELDELAAQAFGSAELMSSLAALDEHLQALRPDAGWSGSENFRGDGAVGLGEGTGLMAQLGELDALSEQLGQAYPGARLADVDLDALARQLGDRAAADARDLAELERALRDSGLLSKGIDGNLRLSPVAMRQLGKELLRDVARRLSGRQGQRDARRTGAAGELSGASRAWEFGDTEPWNVTRTLTNSVLREAGSRPRRQGRVRIEVGDVEVNETEARTQACVALCVDTSFSMVMEGWVPMKRTALALHTLITTRFRGDDLELIAFGRAAQKMSIEELTGLPGKYEKGTNLHHALLLANRHFRKHPSMQPVLLIVTDGEPTSHLEPGGEVHFSYPPHPLTLAYAVRELDAAARLGAHTTFFRLGEDPGLARFVDSMARRVHGRVVAPSMADLGAAVVGSYLGARAQETWID